MKKQLLTLTILTFLTFNAAAITPGTYAAESTTNEKVEMGELNKNNFFTGLTGNLLSLTAAETAEPGETISFRAEATLTETIDTEGKVKIIEFYKCADSTCENGEQDEFLEAARDTTSFSTTLNEGETWGWGVDYTVPEEEGYYAAAAYIWNPETSSLVSDTSVHKFEVRKSETTTEEKISLSTTPSFTVNDDENSVTGTLGIQNTGNADMADSDIVEMQVRPEGQGPLSFTSSQRTCDESFPNNVHKEYKISSGSERTISLKASSDMQDGESFTVYFLTREACGGEKTKPIFNSYNAGTFTFDEGSQDASEPEDVVQVSKPKVSVNNEGVVSSEISFKNEGGDMADSDIVEMQVRPEGSLPLAFSSTTSVCDPSRPENVHKSFNLKAGEKASTVLSTSAVSDKQGDYTVFLLTREGCAPNNEKTEPYFNSVRAGTVTIEDEGSFVSVIEENQLVVLFGGFVVLAAGAWLIFG